MYAMPRYADELLTDAPIAPTGTFERVEQLLEDYRGTLPFQELEVYRAEFEHTGAREALRYAMEQADNTVMPRRYRAWNALALAAEDYADAIGE